MMCLHPLLNPAVNRGLVPYSNINPIISLEVSIAAAATLIENCASDADVSLLDCSFMNKSLRHTKVTIISQVVEHGLVR